MNKPVCLGLSILKMSKILIYKFCYDYVKQNVVKNKIVLCRYITFHCIHNKK